MDSQMAEILYPLSFREKDAMILGEHLQHRHSVDIIGMKRVGISNFLRFFLYHEGISRRYVHPSQKHLFIPVDLNDLVEREIYPFWTLTFKRIVDQVEKADLPLEVQQKVASSFLSAIQSQDLFLLIDGIRRSLAMLVEKGYLPTLFLLRFDRIKNVVTPEFFDNLQGLRDAAGGQLAFVFTSYRSLDTLSPDVLTRASLLAFLHIMYLKPLTKEDMQMIYEGYKKRYQIVLTKTLQQELFRLVGGDAQYLQLSLIALREKNKRMPSTEDALFELLVHDERITLQSEELWDSLTEEEKELLVVVTKGGSISQGAKKHLPYIFDTGMVSRERGTLFSPLFADYITTHMQEVGQGKEIAFSKKEHLLFTKLEASLGEICEREDIIEAVWPEYQEFGVSDWSIDRLVARVRSKLKQQGSPFEIKTIRTRGYVLISKG